MKKFLKYEFKKNLWALLIISLCCALPYLLLTATSKMTWESTSWVDGTKYTYVNSPGTWLVYVELLALCFGVPVATYRFKMKKRSVDCYYSLPIKKEKLYFIKTLVGLCLVLVPFTISFWGGFLMLLIRPGNPFKMGWFVPQYLGLLFFAICLYGFNAFTFTRANTVGDGIVFMVAYTFVALVVSATGLMVINLINHVWDWNVFEYLITPMGSIIFNIKMEALIKGDLAKWNVCMFLIPAIFGAIGYFFLFFSLRYDKGENAEQVSDSWFGYRMLIPVYAACFTGYLGAFGELILFGFLFVSIVVSTFVATMVYRRKFLFPAKNLIMIGVGLGVGIVLAVIIAAVTG